MFVQGTEYTVYGGEAFPKTTGIQDTDSQSGPKKTSQKTDDGLGKDAFFKILIAQLTHQDPLNPLQDRDFIAQMAQFTTVEQLANVAKVVEEMATVNKGTAVSYIGRNVSFYDEKGQLQAGKVEAVRFDEKKGVMLVLSDLSGISSKKIEIGMREVLAVA
ncbi:flagellar hook capping FlgD N-terminal domain-containing protein [Aminobacterium mobile]|jgi:flagellar basal-body rod modification protein FlgD|uniref:flagellar hook capping FlgD N-terminal domain-containing protein n=1 Tax=Aminobacterium mobile TaxID=81467 RepID=UPI0004644755|nr:flagellar hook capping FlgD N-terminal domain-containing protein [Aminobacterium mobile]